MTFFLAQAVGKKFSAVLGFESEDDAKKRHRSSRRRRARASEGMWEQPLRLLTQRRELLPCRVGRMSNWSVQNKSR
jgi:hypothetical protein